MLDLVGDILNWAAAGALFPLMLLPLAALLNGTRLAGTLVWLALAIGLVGAGAAFAQFAPRGGGAPPADAAIVFAAIVAALGLAILAAGGPRAATARLAGPAQAFARLAGRVSMWLVLAMALVQFTIVILRYVFGISILAMQESITYMHGAVFLLAGGYALLTDDQVRVDIFYREASARAKALVDFLGTYLFLVPVCLVIIWTATGYVGQSWLVREGSAEQSGVQGVFLLKSLIPAFALLMLMAGFSIAARAAETLRGGRPLGEEPVDDMKPPPAGEIAPGGGV